MLFNNKKYHLELDIGDWCIAESDERGWRGASVLEASGDTYEEMLEDATVFWDDQDGGEWGQTQLFDIFGLDKRFQEYVEQRIKEIVSADLHV